MSMSKERDQEIRGFLVGFNGRDEIPVDHGITAPLLLAIWDLLVELGAVRDELLQLRSKLLADTIEITVEETTPADPEPARTP